MSKIKNLLTVVCLLCFVSHISAQTEITTKIEVRDGVIYGMPPPPPVPPKPTLTPANSSSIQGDKFINAFFNFSLNFDTTWVMPNAEQKKLLTEAGKRLMAGDDKVLAANLEAAQQKVTQIFNLNKYELGAAVRFNPNIIIVAEDIKLYPGIKNGSDYLFHTRNFLEKSAAKFQFEEEVTPFQKIGEKDFYFLNTYTESLNVVKVHQSYCITTLNGFALGFILTYSNEEEKQELLKMFDTLKI